MTKARQSPWTGSPSGSNRTLGVAKAGKAATPVAGAFSTCCRCSDHPRPDSAPTIAQGNQHSIKVKMLTSDDATIAARSPAHRLPDPDLLPAELPSSTISGAAASPTTKKNASKPPNGFAEV